MLLAIILPIPLQIVTIPILIIIPQQTLKIILVVLVMVSVEAVAIQGGDLQGTEIILPGIIYIKLLNYLMDMVIYLFIFFFFGQDCVLFNNKKKNLSKERGGGRVHLYNTFFTVT